MNPERPLRVGVIAHHYLPAQNGIARAAAAVALPLAKRGHEVHVLTGPVPGVPVQDRLDGIQVTRFAPKKFRWWSLPHQPFRKLVRRAEMDAWVLLHQDTWQSNHLVDLWPKLGGVKIYIPIEFHRVRSKGYSSEWGHRIWNRFVNRRLLDFSDLIVAVTPDEAAELRAYLGAVKRIEMIPLGLPAEAFLAGDGRALDRFGLVAGHFGLHVSDAHKNKRRDLAVALASRSRTAIKWVFAGRGSDSVALAGARGLGIVDPAELRALYAGAAMLLHTSTAEGYGYVLLEALAQGTPFVSGPVGVASELADQGGGVLAETGAEQTGEDALRAYEVAVEKALETPWDREGLRSVARTYGDDRVGVRLAETIEKVARAR